MWLNSDVILIPNDSKTSKLPDFEVTLLFPCLEILISKVERSIEVAVEKLKLPLLSPPVPQVSINLSLILKDFLDLKKFELKDINKIYINRGPGSFAGIRNSISLVKALKLAKNIDYQ